jgi:hypothetical protein
MQKLAGVPVKEIVEASQADNTPETLTEGMHKKKMTKMEAKKMIKDAILAEMSHDDDPRDELADPHNLPGGQYLDEAVNLNLSRAAKQIYSFIKKGGYDVSLHIHGSEKGAKNIMGKGGKGSYSVTLFNDKIVVQGYFGMPKSRGDQGYDEQQQLIAKIVSDLKGLADDILKAFPFLELKSNKGSEVTFKVNEKLMKTGAVTEAFPDAINRMDSLVDQNAKFTLVKTVRSIIRDLKMEGFEDDDIFDYIMDLVKTLPGKEESYYDADKEQNDDTVAVPMGDEGDPLEEAKKDKEEAGDEVEIEDEETVKEPAADDNVDMDMEGDLDLDAGSDEAKDAFDELTDAYRAAKELGDEKLVRQLANTITYFNKNIILK